MKGVMVTLIASLCSLLLVYIHRITISIENIESLLRKIDKGDKSNDHF